MNIPNTRPSPASVKSPSTPTTSIAPRNSIAMYSDCRSSSARASLAFSIVVACV